MVAVTKLGASETSQAVIVGAWVGEALSLHLWQQSVTHHALTALRGSLLGANEQWGHRTGRWRLMSSHEGNPLLTVAWRLSAFVPSLLPF